MSTTSNRRGSRLLALAGAALLGACSEPGPEAKPVPPSTYAKTAAPPAAAGAGPPPPFSSFADAGDAAGVRFVHENGARGGKLLLETMGSGAAVLDFDGDGRMDLFLVNGAPWPGDAPRPEASAGCRLLRNRGDGTFEDRTAEAGLGGAAFFGMGAAAADYDADGDADLFVTAVGPSRLYRNDGGRFTEVAAAAGVAGEPWTDPEGWPRDPCGSAAAWLDYDRDGVLDLYAARYVRWSRETDVFSSLDGRTKAYTIPDRYRGDSGRLYRGRGDGTFEDATAAAGLRNDDAKTLGVAACDLDGDGWTDLCVANDAVANHLYLNNRDGAFRECALSAGVAYDNQGKARADMGIAVGPVDRDGLPAVVTGTFSMEPLAFYRRQTRARTFTFVDEGPAAGLSGPTFPSLTFGVLLQDLDLDGHLDLFVANGHIEPTIQEVMRSIPYAQGAQVFRNRGDGRFEDASGRAGPALALPAVGRGLAWLDHDGDGDADLLLTQNGREARLLRNDAPAGRKSIRIRLRGAGGNRDALGAVVTVAAGGRSLSLERASGGSYLSESEPTLLFGLGEAAKADSVKVRWPSKEGAAAPEEDLGSLAAGLWLVPRGGPPERLGE
jgi:hypothetical protein